MLFLRKCALYESVVDAAVVIKDYANKIAGPLRDIVKDALFGTNRTMSAAKRIKLSSTPWGEREKLAVKALKDAMKDAVPLDWYDESMVQVVMCDASELFWGVVIMQCVRMRTHSDR